PSSQAHHTNKGLPRFSPPDGRPSVGWKDRSAIFTTICCCVLICCLASVPHSHAQSSDDLSSATASSTNSFPPDSASTNAFEAAVQALLPSQATGPDPAALAAEAQALQLLTNNGAQLPPLVDVSPAQPPQPEEIQLT